jgi:[CysO sulfur-carrier protein]-S-L-cysteine hydrolase
LRGILTGHGSQTRAVPVCFGVPLKRARIARMEGNCRITRNALHQMLEAARENSTHECCGLLAGRDNTITAVFVAHNALASATAYEIAPQELLALFREIRARNLDFLGIYHSHPQTENIPSPTDIARAYYPDAIHFIVSPKPGAPKPIRAFRIHAGKVTELIVEEAL